jgi:hypothetical protein
LRERHIVFDNHLAWEKQVGEAKIQPLLDAIGQIVTLTFLAVNEKDPASGAFCFN